MFLCSPRCGYWMPPREQSDSHGVETLVDAAEVVILGTQLGGMLLVVGTPQRRGQIGQIHVVAVSGNGGFDQQVNALGILLAVDGVEIARCAHYKLTGAVLKYHIVNQCRHVIIDVAHIVGYVLIGQQTVAVVVEYLFEIVVHYVSVMWFVYKLQR